MTKMQQLPDSGCSINGMIVFFVGPQRYCVCVCVLSEEYWQFGPYVPRRVGQGPLEDISCARKLVLKPWAYAS